MTNKKQNSEKTKDNNKEQKFIEVIKKTTDAISDVNIDEKLSEVIKEETGIDIKKVKKSVEDISETIEVIAENFEDLQKAKEKGKSRAEWLKDKLDSTIEKQNIKNTEELITEVKDALKGSNRKIGIEIFGQEIDISEPLTNPKYENLNKTAIVKDFQEEIKNNTLLGAVIFENGKIKIDERHKEIKAVKDYFEAKLDSPYDKTFKKAVSAATLIAQEKKILPEKFKNKTPNEIAMIVDKGVTTSKVAYKLGKGEISPVDAVEYVIDRNATILNSAIVTTTTRYGGAIVGRIGSVIGSVFGPVGTAVGTAIGTVVGKVGGYAVGKFLGEGIKKVARVVKSVVSTAWEAVKSFASVLNPSNWF